MFDATIGAIFVIIVSEFLGRNWIAKWLEREVTEERKK